MLSKSVNLVCWDDAGIQTASSSQVLAETRCDFEYPEKFAQTSLRSKHCLESLVLALVPLGVIVSQQYRELEHVLTHVPNAGQTASITQATYL